MKSNLNARIIAWGIVIAIVCFCIPVGLVCAEESAEGERPFIITVDTVMDALYIRNFSGDYATKEPAVSGSPYRYQGEGDIKSFQTSAFDDGLNARVKFAYSNEKLGGLLLFKAQQDTTFADSWDWEAWLRFNQYLKVTAGNVAQRGQMALYQNFDDFLKTKVDPFGVLFPTWKANPRDLNGNNFDTTANFPWGTMTSSGIYGYALFSTTDTNDLFMPAGGIPARQTMGLLLDASYAPVTLSASVGGLYEKLSRPFKTPWESTGTVLNNYDDTYDPLLTTGINFGFRAEGAKIADLFSVAAMYKYAESTLTKLEAYETSSIIDEETGNHAFGVYANIAPIIPGLGISVGYSALIQRWKNSENTTLVQGLPPDDINKHELSEQHEVLFPYYSGIDLRASYTGIEKLSITFNNNISFAQAHGVTLAERTDKIFAKSWAYEGQLNESSAAAADRYETYLGLYNALGAKYQFSSVFTADVQVANQLGVFALNWEKTPLQSVTDWLSLYAGVSYQVYKRGNVHGSIRGGLAMRVGSFRYQEAAAATVYTHTAGFTEIGIPVALKVEF